MAYMQRTRTAAAIIAAAILLTWAGPAAAARSAPGSGLVGASSTGSTHVVQPGDTLSEIAAAHGLSTAELAGANGLSDRHLIRVGQVLHVPATAPSNHTVAPGDTLSGIASAYGVASAELAALNGLTDPDRLRPGQVLQLPATASRDAASIRAASSATYPSLPGRIVAGGERLDLLPVFEHWAAHYGVPSDLLMAVAYQESGWQAGVVSHKGAVGVGQLLPSTASWVATDLIGVAGLDPADPDSNIRMSARFLAWLIARTGGEDAALAAYYQGPTSVATRGLYDDTKVYIGNVQAVRWRFQRG